MGIAFRPDPDLPFQLTDDIDRLCVFSVGCSRPIAGHKDILARIVLDAAVDQVSLFITAFLINFICKNVPAEYRAAAEVDPAAFFQAAVHGKIDARAVSGILN